MRSRRENTVSDPPDSRRGDHRLPCVLLVGLSVYVWRGRGSLDLLPPAPEPWKKRGRECGGLALERVRGQVWRWLKSPLGLLQAPQDRVRLFCHVGTRAEASGTPPRWAVFAAAITQQLARKTNGLGNHFKLTLSPLQALL